jgi:hypothetical protein
MGLGLVEGSFFNCMRRGVVSNFFLWGEVVGFSNCYCAVNFFMWRKMVSVNFLSCDSLCRSLSVGKDTLHHPAGGEEHITAY